MTVKIYQQAVISSPSFCHMEGTSPLLALPGELRNVIYEYLQIDEHPLTLKRRKPRCRKAPHDKQHIKTICRFIATCRQINHEYHTLLEQSTHKSDHGVTVCIANLNFYRVINFFDDLPAYQDGSCLRIPKLIIILRMKQDNAVATAAHLRQWAEFCMGKTVEVEWVASNPHWRWISRHYSLDWFEQVRKAARRIPSDSFEVGVLQKMLEILADIEKAVR